MAPKDTLSTQLHYSVHLDTNLNCLNSLHDILHCNTPHHTTNTELLLYQCSTDLSKDTLDSMVMLLDTLNVSRVTRARSGRWIGLKQEEQELNDNTEKS